VVDDATFCIDSTSSRTWIGTFRVDTGFCLWTVRVENTLGSASNLRISLVVLDTRTNRSSSLNPAFSVGSTGCWVARIRGRWLCLRPLDTSGEWISDESRWTAANGIVVLNGADCQNSTGAGTWIDALLSNARSGCGAVGVVDALSSAASLAGRISLVAATTAALDVSEGILVAVGVGSARGRTAGVSHLAAFEWIANKSRIATTFFSIIADKTFSVDAAWTWFTE
jgi:hypothetical protein